MQRELYDTYSDPYQLNNQISNPIYGPVAFQLAGELDRLIDCAGVRCREHPTGDLGLDSAGTGERGCGLAPVTASFQGSSEGLASVEFLVENKSIIADTVAPFEAELPQKKLRSALPDKAEVVARANYTDGRRLAVVGKIRACR